MGLLSAGIALCGIGCAGVAGYNGWCAFEAWQRRVKHKDAVRGSHERTPLAPTVRTGSVDDKVIAFLEDQSRKQALGRTKRLLAEAFIQRRWLEKHEHKAGIKGRISAVGFCEGRLRLALAGGVVLGLIGLLFSPAFAVVLCIVGVLLGARMPAQAIEHRMEWRAQEMERHLPEMLDVVALGMRSGLSFDASVRLYAEHFNTMLAAEFASAQRQWSAGLERRDEALRSIAASYDSVVFGRIVETMIRSIRFGSSMVESLEADATEARSAYRSRREEQIAKAPVKMMVPTGTLILPAMLIMVMGPVLLELIGGGI